ncbi:MAG: tyrosine--tRNA ligase [Candidatus Diapherotrites archaeon]|nr:tyrosine--tRNA ligase [Candidatus Diapherotrites archaeon]
MGVKEKIEIATSGVEEVVTLDELKALLEKNKNPVVYTGYEVSGPVHIGHYYTIQKLKQMQKIGFKIKFLLADLHTWLNRKGDEEWIAEMVDYWRETAIAAGLDREKTDFVVGTDYQLKPDYIKNVLSLGLETTVNRAMRSMQEIARDIDNAMVSQMVYPLMQAYDIKSLGVDIAMGGMEQRKIHMLAREMLARQGYSFVAFHTPLLMGLTSTGKMSSSKPETNIMLHDSPEVIRKKISDAFCPAGQTQGNPVIQWTDLLVFDFLKESKREFDVKRPEKFGGNVSFASIEELGKAFESKDLHPMDLKTSVADYLVEMLEPVRKHFESNQGVLSPLEKISK